MGDSAWLSQNRVSPIGGRRRVFRIPADLVRACGDNESPRAWSTVVVAAPVRRTPTLPLNHAGFQHAPAFAVYDVERGSKLCVQERERGRVGLG